MTQSNTSVKPPPQTKLPFIGQRKWVRTSLFEAVFWYKDFVDNSSNYSEHSQQLVQLDDIISVYFVVRPNFSIVPNSILGSNRGYFARWPISCKASNLTLSSLPKKCTFVISAKDRVSKTLTKFYRTSRHHMFHIMSYPNENEPESVGGKLIKLSNIHVCAYVLADPFSFQQHM